MTIFPLTIGSRVFIGAEFAFLGWKSWMFGFEFDWQPALQLGPWALIIHEH